MTDTTNLLPCPFCGGEAEMRSSSTGFHWAACTSKHCRAEGCPTMPQSAALAAWNRRATSPDLAALRAEVERLKHIEQAAAQSAAFVTTLRARVEALEKLLRRYRDETPLGHQPHMIAAEVDAALEPRE